MPVQNWNELSQFALELARVSAKAILPFFRQDTRVEVKAGVANAYFRTGVIQARLGDRVAAEKGYRESAELYGQISERIARLMNVQMCGILLHDAELNQLVSAANRYIDSTEPYKQDDPADSLYTLVQVLAHLSLLYWPFIPTSAETLQANLGLKASEWTAKDLLKWEKVSAGAPVSAGQPLFPK